MAKTDLIERLRKRALVVHLAADAGPAADLDATMREAADRIEELEGETESLMNTLDCHAGFCSHHVPCNGPVVRSPKEESGEQR